MATRIQRLKNQLKSGVSQEEAEQIRQKILNLGGKVNLTNFGYNVSGQNPGQTSTTSPDPSPTPQDVAGATNQAKPIRDPGSVYEADQMAEVDESQKQILYQNPNVTNPFGSQGVTLNPDGTVSVDQSLSGNQQKILDQGEGLTQTGQQEAQNLLGGYQQFQGPQYDRAAMESAVYDRLMRGQEQDYEQTRKEKEQELFNKGIPYSDDPESRFQRELGDIDRRYDEQKLQARSQATAQGAQEYGAEFGRGLTTHQQSLSDMATLQSQGTGLQLPNFQQYQGPNYDVADPSSYIYAGKELKQGNKALNLQQQQLQQQGAIANKQLAAQAAAANQPPAPPPFP